MEKLFNDSETFTKERPTKATEQQLRKFYEETAEEIIDNDWSNSDIEDIIIDLSNLDMSDNGYIVAKRLDDYSNKASYNINPCFVDFLDNLSWEKSNLVRQNIKDWVKAHNPKPKLKKGDELIVKTPLFFGNKIDSIIYITGIKEEEACYLMHEDKNNNGGYVISFEKVEENCKLSNSK